MDEVAAEFAARIRNKDTQALVEFIELRRPQLLAFIERNLSTSLGRKLEATDILQEVSLSAVGSLATFELGRPRSLFVALPAGRAQNHRRASQAGRRPETLRRSRAAVAGKQRRQHATRRLYRHARGQHDDAQRGPFSRPTRIPPAAGAQEPAGRISTRTATALCRRAAVEGDRQPRCKRPTVRPACSSRGRWPSCKNCCGTTASSPVSSIRRDMTRNRKRPGGQINPPAAFNRLPFRL